MTATALPPFTPCLASARTVNRMDTVAWHKRMIDHLKRKEEELEACLN
jgi:hypothetical protein